MSKPWRLTRQAEEALTEIARWTLDTFGPHQAKAYERDLIARCAEIAEGDALTQSCRQLVNPDMPEDLRFARAAGHFIVFIDDPDGIVIVDFIHARADLPGRLAAFRRGD